MLEKLDIDKTAKNQIRQAVKNGKMVVVPEEDIYYYEWKGTGYIIFDLETFEAAYMVNGGICGGSTSSKLAFSIAGMVNIILLAFDLVGALAFLATAATPVSVVVAILFVLVTIMQIMDMEKTFADYLMYHNPDDGKQMCLELIGNVICHSVAVAAMSLVKEVKVLFRKAMERIDDGKFMRIPGNRNWDGLILEGVGDNPEAGTGTVKELYEALTGTYGTKVAEEAVERGEEGISYIAKYKKGLADAVEAATEPDDVYRLIKRFKNKSSVVLKEVAEYGDDAIRMIDWYGDDALDRFEKGETLDEIRKALGSENIISEADEIKLSKWKDAPSYDIYLEYKSIFDNPKYYNQKTGAIPYEMRSLAPGTNLKQYSVFEIIKPIKVKFGSIASWFDEPGGVQYLLPDTIEELLNNNIFRRIQ